MGEEDGDGDDGGRGGIEVGEMVRKCVTSASLSNDAASSGSVG